MPVVGTVGEPGIAVLLTPRGVETVPCRVITEGSWTVGVLEAAPSGNQLERPGSVDGEVVSYPSTPMHRVSQPHTRDTSRVRGINRTSSIQLPSGAGRNRFLPASRSPHYGTGGISQLGRLVSVVACEWDQ